MGSLGGCFKRLQIVGAEADYIRGLVKAYRDEGVPGMEANTRAVRDLIRDMKSERAKVVQQIRDAVGRVTDEIDGKPSPATTVTIASLDDYDAFRKRLIDGEASLEEYREAFAQVQANKDALLASLNMLNKEQLLRRTNSFHARMSDSKKSLVNQAYQSLFGGFSLGRGVMYSFSGGNTYEQAVGKMVEETTADELQKFAGDVAENRAERKKRIEGALNPQTLEDFDLRIRVKGESSLTPEEAARYDELLAAAGRSRRQAEQEKKSVVQGVQAGTDMTLTETIHTRDKHPIWVVKLADRVPGEVYSQLNSAAKRLGGYYSSYSKNGAIPGFTFTTKEAAEQFMSAGRGESVSTASTQEAKQDTSKKNAAAKLREMADTLDGKADAVLNADRKTNTARRASMASHAENAAYADKALAQTMRNLSDAIESGEATHLDGLKTKAQVEMLDSMIVQAKYQRIRKETGSYSEYERQKDRPATAEDAAFAEFPAILSDRARLQGVVNDLKGRPGTDRLRLRFQKQIAKASDENNFPVSREDAELALEKYPPGKMRTPPWQWPESISKIKRLESMGITSAPELRAALREFVDYRGKKGAIDKAKQLERKLIGNKGIGNDFFPTPKATAERMVRMADIAPGMKVLEPSAGNGNIAEAIKSAGVSPDVVESSSSLREILEAKGFNLVGSDFMDYAEGGYDRIVMNPPFSNGQDAEHIQHAYELLKPGGKIVAIAGEGIFFRSDAKAQGFRSWLDAHNGESESLPAGTFNDTSLMATTGVNARLVTVEKPADERASFQRRYSSSLLGKAELDEIAGRIDTGNTPVFVLPFDRLPAPIQEEANKLGAPAEEFRAVYWHDAVYLIEDRFASAADAEEAVFHELYHKWVSGLLGGSMQQDLNAIFDRMGGPEALLKLADKYQWKEARSIMKAYADRKDLSRRERTAAVVNELLAEMGSRSVSPTGMQRIQAFIGAVRQWLRDHGFAELSRITESDLLHLLKQARDTHGELKANGNRPYFQSTPNAPTFFSNLSRVIERKMPNKASASQLAGMLNPNNGVKPDELKWSGLDDFMKTKENFTKQEVMDFLDQNNVQVQEVMKGKETPALKWEETRDGIWREKDYDYEIERNGMLYLVRDAQGKTIAHSVTLADAKSQAAADLYALGIESGEATKFSQYQIPGGTDYRELLLTLPEKEPKGFKVFQQDNGSWAVRFPDNFVLGEWRTRQDALASQRKQASSSTFTSPHFSEPNILAHVRFNTRMVDGKKVLFLEEVQSDWHQKGRKEGYAGNSPVPTKAIDRNGYWEVQDADGRFITNVMHRTGRDPYSESQAIEEAKRRLLEDPRSTAIRGTVPDAPFKKTWHELAMKRMLRYAAEQGYDRIAWTTGEQQAERYDLSKQIDAIYYLDNMDGTYNLSAVKGGEELIGKEDQTIDQVSDLVGKEIAQYIQQGDGKEESGEDGNPYKALSGLQLKVGGEGMKGFYDKILPDFLNKYGKKWGAKTEDISIGFPDRNLPSYVNKNDARVPAEKETVHSLHITDAMKESVMKEGQPLFQRRTATDDIGLTDDILNSPDFSGLPPVQQQAAITYQLPAMSKMDDTIRLLQDKSIDLVRLVDAVRSTGKTVSDDQNPALKEELYLGRVSHLNETFLNDELRPLLTAMRLNKIILDQLDEYLHARHAKEANAHLKEINPDRDDNDALSGMTDAEADRILSQADRGKMDRLAAQVDAILSKSRSLLVDYGLESQQTVDGWAKQYSAYVPLHRAGFEEHGQGTGTGRSVRGAHSRSRTGSNREVTNILANIAMDRERVITRGEKMRPVIAMAGLLQQHPNAEVGRLVKPEALRYTNPDTGMQETAPGDVGDYRAPRIKALNKKTGMVEWRPDPLYKGRENVVNFRVNGEDHAIVFNEENPRAAQIARALKDLDVGQLNGALAAIAPATRYLSAINTQYNPVFGVVNAARDIQFAMLTLSTTPLAGKRGAVLAATTKALRGIYQDARAVRNGKTPSSSTSALWERFQKVGGPTGYKEMFRSSNDRAKAIEHMLDPDWWTKTMGGKILTLNGHLNGVHSLILNKIAKPVFEWLSDYNQAMENAVRLGAFKAALDQGMSDEQAASLAKNLTVNFNRKGNVTTQLGTMYAFFNASVQGTTRIAETLFEKGTFGTLSATGKKIVTGGVLVGMAQAAMLALAGFDDDEPPPFVREKSLIVPVPGTDKGYVAIPMPLGFNILPNFGRLVMEAMIYGKPMERAYAFAGMTLDAFSPVGGGSSVAQLLTPTLADPLVALSENKDWAGRKIVKEDMNPLKPTPGHTRAKDSATPWARGISEAINWATGGTDYVPGKFSPTPDAIDYLIGTVTGGVGREVSKTAQTASSIMTGEDLPMHKVPLLGRFAGTASSPSAVKNQFYENLLEVNQAAEEVKGRRLHGEDASEYLDEHPEARLAQAASHLEREIAAMNRNKRELVKRGVSAERIRLIEMQIAARMERFNQRVREMQAAR